MNDEAIRAALYRSLATGRRVVPDSVRAGVRFVDGTRNLFATDAQLERVLDEIGRLRTLIEPESRIRNEGPGLG